MSRKRRKLGAVLKAKVALAAFKGDKTTAQLASEFGVHTSQVTAWKKRLTASVGELFAGGRWHRGQKNVERCACTMRLMVDLLQVGQGSSVRA